jgi:very-short-patch-repair endonuclease
MTYTDNEFIKEKQRLLSKYQLNMKRKPTPSESLFESLLIELGLKYKAQKGFFAGHKSFIILDFWLPRPYRVGIEIDGLYHNYPEVVLKDAAKEAYLKKRRFHLIRFKNEDLKDMDLVREKLTAFIDKACKANKAHKLRKDREVLISK